jgi:benzil reductase ((S)-benzoin forming)
LKTTYFITGTSKGIGNALAGFLLPNASHTIYGYARGTSDLDSKNYIHSQLDLSNPAVLQDFVFPETKDERIVLVNNAGLINPIAHGGHQDFATMQKQLNINVLAPMQLCNQFIKQFSGSNAKLIIINISSGAGKSPIDGWSTYCASKAAIDLFSQTIALESELNNTGLKIYAIAPGVVDTPMQREIRTADKKQFSRLDHFIELNKNKDLTSPEIVVKKLDYIIRHSSEFPSVLLSLRDIEIQK